MINASGGGAGKPPPKEKGDPPGSRINSGIKLPRGK